MCWSAAPPIRSRCSRSACRARSVSLSRPDLKASSCARAVSNKTVNDHVVGGLPLVVKKTDPSRCKAGEKLNVSCAAAMFFRLAKAAVQAEHLPLPTQSRAELQIKEAANGTRRQKSPRSTVHCAGGPIPKRKDYSSRSDIGTDRRDPACRECRCRHLGRRFQRRGAPSQDERCTHCRHHH